MLERRATREAEQLGIEANGLKAIIETLLDDLERMGLIDDRTFAQARAEKLVERGKSRRLVRSTLLAKGISRELAEEMLDDDDDTAALNFARRRRLGPWRAGEDGPEVRRKEMAVLARGGFDYATARRVVDSEPPDD